MFNCVSFHSVCVLKILENYENITKYIEETNKRFKFLINISQQCLSLNAAFETNFDLKWNNILHEKHF